MKKYTVIIIVISMIFAGGCSVQKNMNTELFFKRLSSVTHDFDYGNKKLIYEENNCVCFVKDKKSTDYIFEFFMNENGDINKISFACKKTDKAEDFIKYISDIISVYSSDNNSGEIIRSLTENGKIKPSYSYFETQWYYWSSFSDKNGLYFSVINKKLSDNITAEFSLKPNDKTGF